MSTKFFPHKEKEAREEKICYKMDDGSLIAFQYFAGGSVVCAVTIHNGGDTVDSFIKTYGYTVKPFKESGIVGLWETTR